MSFQNHFIRVKWNNYSFDLNVAAFVLHEVLETERSPARDIVMIVPVIREILFGGDS
jgi:hypothetical protein